MSRSSCWLWPSATIYLMKDDLVLLPLLHTPIPQFWFQFRTLFSVTFLYYKCYLCHKCNWFIEVNYYFFFLAVLGSGLNYFLNFFLLNSSFLYIKI
jgi:hypothetical protein